MTAASTSAPPVSWLRGKRLWISIAAVAASMFLGNILVVYSRARDYWILTGYNFSGFPLPTFPIFVQDDSVFASMFSGTKRYFSLSFSNSHLLYATSDFKHIFSLSVAPTQIRHLHVLTFYRDDPMIAIELPRGSFAPYAIAKEKRQPAAALDTLRQARRDYPHRLEFAVLLAHELCLQGYEKEAQGILAPLQTLTPADWREEFLVAMAQADYLAVSTPADAPAGTWPRVAPEVYRFPRKALPLEDTTAILKRSDEWANPFLIALEARTSRHDIEIILGFANARLSLDVLSGNKQDAVAILAGLLKWRPGGNRPASVFARVGNRNARQDCLSMYRQVLESFPLEAEFLKEWWASMESVLATDSISEESDWEILQYPSQHFAAKNPGALTFLKDYNTHLLKASSFDRTRLDLIRQAVRVQHYRRTSGDWPADLSSLQHGDFALTSPTEPIDRYAPDGQFRFLPPAGPDDPFVLYSIGPDGVDDGAVAECSSYFPTQNSGDILIRLRP